MTISTEVRQLCDEVAKFVREQVDPRSRWIEENDAIPDDLMQLARDMGLFSMEEAVRKMTGHTAEVFGMVETVLHFGYSKQARHTGENTSQKGFQHEAQPNR